MSQLSNAEVVPVSRAVPSSARASLPAAVPARADGRSLKGTPETRGPEAMAQKIYEDLRSAGFSEQQVIALAGELLSLVTAEVRSKREG